MSAIDQNFMRLSFTTKVTSTVVLVLGYPILLSMAIIERAIEFTASGIYILHRMWTEQ